MDRCPVIGAVERKGRYHRVKPTARRQRHFKTAPHETGWRLQRRAGCVGIALTGLQHGLFADNAGTAHRLDLAGSVRHQPVAGDKLHRFITPVFDLDRIGPHKELTVGVGLIVQKFRRHPHGNPAGFAFITGDFMCLDHAGMISSNAGGFKSRILLFLASA